MKRIIVLTIYSLLFFSIYGTTLSFTDLSKRIARDPVGSLELLDSLEAKESLPQYSIDYLRALAYRTQSRYYMAMYYSRQALNNPEIHRDSLLTSYSYMFLAEASVASFQLAEAANAITEGKKYAETSNDIILRASILQKEGDLYRKMGVLNKGYDCLHEAIGLLSGREDSESCFLLSHCLGYLMGYYVSDTKPKKAWKIGLQREALLQNLESRKDIDAHVLDRHKGLFYSKMAYLLCKMNENEVGKRYADKFYSTAFSSTPMGGLEMNDYLLEVGDFHSVVRHCNDYIAKIDKKDSLNVVYLRTLYQVSKAYNALGQYENAYNSLLKAYNIRNQMRVNRGRNKIFDLTDVTEAISREYKLEKAAYRVQMQHYIIIGLVIFVILLLAMTLGLLYTLRIIHRKNRKMAALIIELDDRRKEILEKEESRLNEVVLPLQEEQTEACESQHVVLDGFFDKDEEKDLFFRFDFQVKEHKLYLDYQLSRDDYARLMGVDRNRFASILKQFTSGGNLSVYLNELRLEYSVSLFRNHPDWSISKVAAESALPNLSTFYRLFKEKYGISPNSFRKTVLK